MLCLCFFTSVPHLALATDGSIEMEHRRNLSDSIVRNVLRFSPIYEKAVESYNAELYVKSIMHVKKRNFFLRFAPFMFRSDRKVKECITESMNELYFSAPNVYSQKVKALSGTTKHLEGMSNITFQYFHMNIYSSSLLCDKLLSPLASNAPKYYTYKIDSVFKDIGGSQYKIRIIPKYQSYQLMDGYMIVSDQQWTVRELYLEGQSEYLKFNVKIWMGSNGSEAFLPVRYKTDIFFKLLGNAIDLNYMANLKYNDIKMSELKTPQNNKTKYDLSESYSLTYSGDSCITDSTHFAKLRPLPLSDADKLLYSDYAMNRQSTYFVKKMYQMNNRAFWGQAGDLLLSSYTVNMSTLGDVKCSPIINPFLMSYSHNDGFSYRQEFKYHRLFSDDRLLRVVPKIGYNFKRSEFYWTINSDFDYWPAKRASIH